MSVFDILARFGPRAGAGGAMGALVGAGGEMSDGDGEFNPLSPLAGAITGAGLGAMTGMRGANPAAELAAALTARPRAAEGLAGVSMRELSGALLDDAGLAAAPMVRSRAEAAPVWERLYLQRKHDDTNNRIMRQYELEDELAPGALRPMYMDDIIGAGRSDGEALERMLHAELGPYSVRGGDLSGPLLAALLAIGAGGAGMGDIS